MKKGYIFANSKIILKSLLDNLNIIESLSLAGSLNISMCIDIVLTEKPNIIFISDEFTKDEYLKFLDQLEDTQFFEKTAIIFVQSEKNENILSWLLNGKYIDFWMEFSSSFAERKFVIEKALEKQNSKALFYKCNMQNEYLQSVLSNYERKNRYQLKVNEDNQIMKLTEIMHTIRTLLTGIEGRALLLADNGLSQQEKAKSSKILISNMNSLKDFLDQEDTFLDERKVYQSKIKISTISKIITRIQKKISFEADQKDIVLETKINNPKQSIVGRGEDFIYVIESIISDYIRIIQPKSILYLFVRPMESAPLVEFVLETDLENLSQDTLLAAFSKVNTSRRILDSIGAQFEFSQGKHMQGIKFYLPRLG